MDEDVLGRILLTVTLGGAGILLLAVGLLQRRGRLRRNWVVGLRTTETLRSDEAWHAAHRATGGLVVASGLPLLVAAIAAVLEPAEPVLGALVLGACAVTVGLVLAAGSRGHRIAEAMNDPATDPTSDADGRRDG